MFKVKRLSVPQNKRLICVSDIHGKLDVLRQLLDKVKLCDGDTLIIVGDICGGRHDNSQSVAIFEYAKALHRRDNVHIVRGNWDCKERLPHEFGEAQKEVAAEWFDTLPHVIETEDHVFIHYKDTGFPTEKYLVEGHWPTLNASQSILSCNPYFEGRVISIDGGLDTWGCGQLNALIIQNGKYSYVSADALPTACAAKAQAASLNPQSIVWTQEKDVELIKAGDEFSMYRHVKSGNTIELPNQSVHTGEDGGLWCSLGTNCFLPVEEGDELKVLHTFSDRLLVKKDGIIGYYAS